MKFRPLRRALRCAIFAALVLGSLAASATPGAQADPIEPYRNPAYSAAFQELLTAKWPNQFSAAESALGTTGIDLSIRDGLFRARGEARTYPRLGVTDVLNFGTDRTWRVYVNANVRYKLGQVTGDPGWGTTALNSNLQGARWAASCRDTSCPDMGSSFPLLYLPPNSRGWWVLNWRYQSPGWSSRLWRCTAYGWTQSNHFCYQKDVDAWAWFGEPNQFHVGGDLVHAVNDDGSVADCDNSSAVEPCYFRVQSVRQMSDRVHFPRFENWTSQAYEADTDFRPYNQVFNADAARDELDWITNNDARAWINHELDPSYPDPRAPSLTAAPVIAGLANQGETLQTTPGTWDRATSPFAYQWMRCDAGAANCVPISGATGTTYVVTSDDIGCRLMVDVTAGNAFGNTVGGSPATPLVLEQVALLALDYRPALRFDRAEGWRPLNIHSFFSDAYLSGASHRLCNRLGSDPTPEDCGPEIVDENALSSPWTGEGTHFIQIHGSQSDGADYETPRTDPSCHADNGFGTTLRDCNAGDATAIYYDAAQSPSGYRYLDYWAFYRYNDVQSVGSLDDHEGDWEGATVVLDARSTTTPAIVGVVFAQHSKLMWVLPDAMQREVAGELLPFGNATGPQHAAAFVATGSHASYPDVCSSACPNPEGFPAPDEGNHSGEAPWGENTTCGACVLELPRDPHMWSFYPGKWGSSIPNTMPDGSQIGGSPDSPALQDRFLCNQAHWNCGSRPGGMELFSARGSHRRGVMNPKYCASWAGGDVAAIACDEAVLASAIANHELRSRGAYGLEVSGHQAGAAPGLAQVIGKPLAVGDRIRVHGWPTPRTRIAVRVQFGDRIFVLQGRIPAGHAFAVVRVEAARPRLMWLRSR